MIRRNDGYDIICDFLSTLDSFGITSDDPTDKNWLGTENLLEYWQCKGYVKR